MRPRKFVKELQRIVKRDFPDLYVKNIAGRLVQFTNDAAPSHTDKTGTRVGRANMYLRMIWSLYRMFRTEGLAILKGSKNTETSFAGAQTIKGIALCAMSDLCLAAFWEFAMIELDIKKREGEGMFILDTDWSIVFVENEAADEANPGGLFDCLLHGIEGPAIIAGLVSRTSS